jgi:hypothetical protein
VGSVDELAAALRHLSREQARQREAPPAGPRGALEDRGCDTPDGERVGAGEPGQSGPDDGHATQRPRRRPHSRGARPERRDRGRRDAGRDTAEELTPIVAFQVRAVRLNHPLDRLP